MSLSTCHAASLGHVPNGRHPHYILMFLPSFTSFIFALFSVFLPPDVSKHPINNTLNFRLRHFHAVTPSAHVYFADVPLHSSFHTDTQSLSIPITPVRTARPPSAAAFAEARTLSMRGQSAALDWEEDEILGPDVSKRETLLLLAKMTSNSYLEPFTDGWYNLTDQWGIVRRLVLICGVFVPYARPGCSQHAPVGWEPNNDGFRGYIFATDDNSTVVLSIKGTSAQWVVGGPTVEKDKVNDNLLFSCCCARINWSWTTVCDCYRGGWKCNQDCVENALIEDTLFYPLGTVSCSIVLPSPRAIHGGVECPFLVFRICTIISRLCFQTQTSGSSVIHLAAHLQLFLELHLVYQ